MTPRKLLKLGRDNIVARTKELMEEFGSVKGVSSGLTFPSEAPFALRFSLALTRLARSRAMGKLPVSWGPGPLAAGYEAEFIFLTTVRRC